MNQVWLQVFAVLFGGSIVKHFFMNPLVWVIIEIVVLGIAYLILKKHPYIDMKKSITFLGGMTVINIIVDIGVIGPEMGNIAVLGLLGYWLFWGRNR